MTDEGKTAPLDEPQNPDGAGEAETAHRARIADLRSNIKQLKFKTRILDRTMMAAGRLLKGSGRTPTET